MLRLFKGWNTVMLTALSLSLLAISIILIGVVQLRMQYRLMALEARMYKLENWVIEYEKACKEGQVHSLYFDRP